MDVKKILILLIVLIIFVNYNNFFKADIQKLYREIASLERNINKENEISDQNYTKEKLALNNNKIMFDGSKYSFSQAMGEVQKNITESAKDLCIVNNISWAQVPSSKLWYDKLNMNVSLSCRPEKFFLFSNALKENKKLYIVNSLRISKHKRKELIDINMQLIAFRKTDENN